MSLVLLGYESYQRGWLLGQTSIKDTAHSAVDRLTVKKSTQQIAKTGENNKTEQGNKTQRPAVLLNNEGVELVAKKQYWSGLYRFHQAMKSNSSYFEPYLNMALTLNELGLTRSAREYLIKAERLDPNNPVLLKNYSNILHDRGGMDDFSRQKDRLKVRNYMQSKEQIKTDTVLRIRGLDIQ